MEAGDREPPPGSPSPPLKGRGGGGACLSTHLADGRLLEQVLGLDQLRQEEGPLGQLGVELQAGLLLKQPHDVVVVLHPDTDRHRGALNTSLFDGFALLAATGECLGLLR